MIFKEKEYEFGRWKITGNFLWKIPITIAVLYRTQIGINFLDSFAKKHPKAIERLGKISLYTCYASFIILLLLLILSASLFFTPAPPEQEAVAIILPEAAKNVAEGYAPILEPIIKSKWVLLVPTYIWIFSLVMILLIHEGGHALLSSS